MKSRKLEVEVESEKSEALILLLASHLWLVPLSLSVFSLPTSGSSLCTSTCWLVTSFFWLPISNFCFLLQTFYILLLTSHFLLLTSDFSPSTSDFPLWTFRFWCPTSDFHLVFCILLISHFLYIDRKLESEKNRGEIPSHYKSFISGCPSFLELFW